MNLQSVPKKLFIVDDDRLITAIYSDFFSGLGFTVETSNTPFGVTSSIRTFGPDLILVDMNMPGLGGKSLCSLLIRTGSHRIVLISGKTQEPDMQELVTTGLAHDYFIKGHPLTVLNSKLTRLI